jgi:twitching motility protein PilT
MRTPEVIRLTLNAAETGHLVLATLHSATCGEALSRICMSFAPEIQGSIRAQLADCLVGVVCQRLEYLDAFKFRVPRCEVLYANTAAKGTIRAGQLSQIPNVIQAGGEEGMWTFDRYQRWIEQKRDWVRPAPPATSAADESDVVVVTPRPSLTRATPPPARPKPAPGRASVASKPATVPPGDGPIEIPAEDELDLAELAKQIEKRSL